MIVQTAGSVNRLRARPGAVSTSNWTPGSPTSFGPQRPRQPLRRSGTPSPAPRVRGSRLGSRARQRCCRRRSWARPAPRPPCGRRGSRPTALKVRPRSAESPAQPRRPVPVRGRIAPRTRPQHSAPSPPYDPRGSRRSRVAGAADVRAASGPAASGVSRVDEWCLPLPANAQVRAPARAPATTRPAAAITINLLRDISAPWFSRGPTDHSTGFRRRPRAVTEGQSFLTAD